MKSLWNDTEAKAFSNDPLELRVYTSRLLGANPDLVLHGGGNTSVKLNQQNFFGDPEELLLVKGSGWDLATIESCLLYTSPSPRDRTRSRMPSSA